MEIKSPNYKLTISTIVGVVLFLMSANFAFGEEHLLVANSLNNEARKLIGSHNHQEAIELLDKALEINPEHVGALYNKGWALVGLEKQEEAIVWLDKALVLNPNYVDALNMKGNALLGLDKPEEAIVWFDKAIEVNPNYFFALNNKGLMLSNLGRYDEAITYFNKALEINPNYRMAQVNLANTQFEKELIENPPTADSGFEWFLLLIIIPIVFGIYLIQNSRKKSRKKEKWIEASTPKIASFVDPKKDPQRYLDRYYKEKKYKEWFDKNYPNLTIEEAVGLEPPKEKPKM